MKAVMTVVAALSVAALPLAGGAVAQTSGSQPAPKQPGYQAPAAEKPAQGIRPVEKPDELGLWRGSKIIGENVKDARGKSIGKIEDLMVDSNGRVVFAVMSFGGFLGIGDRYFALPWNALRFEHEGNDVKAVVLDVNKETLEKAPSFARDRSPSASDREQARRYWGDTAITAQVKSKLAADRASTLARVDVDTRQGVVELSGSVSDERTKQRATQLAREVDGVKNVVNRLKVQAGG